MKVDFKLLMFRRNNGKGGYWVGRSEYFETYLQKIESYIQGSIPKESFTHQSLIERLHWGASKSQMNMSWHNPQPALIIFIERRPLTSCNKVQESVSLYNMNHEPLVSRDINFITLYSNLMTVSVSSSLSLVFGVYVW